jgi:hypothetical protein
MSDTNKSGINCADYRALFNRIADGDKSVSSTEKNAYEGHVDHCAGCRSWKAQTVDLMDLASGLPNFDVSEALTQRILTSVDSERSKIVSLEHLPAAPLCIIAAVTMILLLPVEGPQGALSWFVSLMGLGLLQALLKSASTTESPG